MQHLCIDIGNTQTKSALFIRGRLAEIYTGIPQHILPDTGRIALLATGKVPAGLRRQLHNIPVLEISSRIHLPFRLNYATPHSLGPDRLALVAGAVKHYRGDLLVIDAGTCITYDLVDAGRNYPGGAISPGVGMRLRAMNAYTAALPLAPVPDAKISLPGTDTLTSLQAGALIGAAAEIDGMIGRFRDQYPALKVILTGGDAPSLLKYIKSKIFAYQKFLSFEGMEYLLQLNPAE